MKPETFFNQLTTSKQCVNTSTLLASLSLLEWRRLPGHVKIKWESMRFKYVQWAAGVIQPAYPSRLLRSLSKRNLVGIVMLGAGVLGFYSGLFFSPTNYDHAPCELFGLTAQCFSFETNTGWCFMSWFVFLNNIKLYLALCLWSIAGFLLVPKKFGGWSFVFFALCGALAWVNLLHITFFARSYETFIEFPQWEIILAGAFISVFGIMMSTEAIEYWEHHKKRGNWQRWPAVHKLNIDQQMKNKIFDELTEEYYKVNKMI